MSDAIIQVENLGKKYIIGHQRQGRSQYTALRDVVTDGVRAIGQALKNPHKAIPPTQREEFWALKDVSFEVKQGEVVGIIGRNGAGKSTLLKILSRITEPTAGRIRLKGRVASLLEVGTGFHPELTGRENIFLNGAILGMSKAEINYKFDEIVEFAEISRFLDTPVKRYSSGMYVRLAFAVAAHMEPEILVVDEVLAVGDIEFQKKCLSKMENIGNSGRTIVFVSHNMSTIKALCSKGIYLSKGSISYSGNIESVVNQYLNCTQMQDQPIYQMTKVTDALIQISSVQILDKNGKLASQHPYSEPFSIHVEYTIREYVSNVYFALHIHDSTLETIVFSRDFEAAEEKLLSRDKGVFSCDVELPSSLLVPGKYSISLHVAHASPPELISGLDFICPFELVDNGSHNAKLGFPWRGKIGIPLYWNERKISQ